MRNVIHNVHMKVLPCLACSLVCGMSVVFAGCSGCFTGCIDCPPSGWRGDGWPWPLLLLGGRFSESVVWCVQTVQLLRALRFSRTRSSLISFLLGWSCGLTSPVCSNKARMMFGLYCTRCWDSEQSFWTRVPLQYVVDDSPTKVSQICWLTSWFNRHRDRPSVYKFEVTAFYREAHPG